MDICSDNVLFDGVNLYMLDFDNSISDVNPEIAYRLMANCLLGLVLSKIIDDFVVSDKDLINFKNQLDMLRSENHSSYLLLLK